MMRTLDDSGSEHLGGCGCLPKRHQEILYRAAERTGVNVTLVANQPLTTPRIPSLRSIQVASGFDVADNELLSVWRLGTWW